METIGDVNLVTWFFKKKVLVSKWHISHVIKLIASTLWIYQCNNWSKSQYYTLYEIWSSETKRRKASQPIPLRIKYVKIEPRSKDQGFKVLQQGCVIQDVIYNFSSSKPEHQFNPTHQMLGIEIQNE